MTPETLAQTIDQLVLTADSRYVLAIGRIQASLYDQLTVILAGLELDVDGYIKQTAANRRVLADANAKIQEVFSSSQYTTAVSNYVAVVPKVDLQNVKYFTSVDEAFKPNKIFLKNLQAETIATVEKYVLQDGLQSQVISPLSQILNQNVNAGGRFSGFLEQIRDYIIGGKAEGRAMSYTRTYLRDSLFTYSRTYHQAVTADLGLTYYLYSGGLIDKSRPFCRALVGRYFSHKEIEALAGQQWAGKKQGTTESSIFMFAGGWNCGHQIIPVHKSIVPREVIKRQ